jgi:hypothetical protein
MDASVEAAAAGAFGAMCTMASDCQSGVCEPFPAKGGSFCTMKCTSGPCPMGCNGMGYCKVP